MLNSLFLVLALTTLAATGGSNDYPALKAEAERLVAAKSYGQAYELYLKVKAAELAPPEQRWVRFRLADTAWRAQAASPNADSSIFEKAQRQLDELVRDAARPE